ncbi:RNA polymerase sigma-70 factor [Zunongwangia sp. HGR-M22]|uniref:RNA polymerase sigma-70 factor n=1 Tax=Zunongwangia sp. HGR-M22 TaxID=3015168 RepID=UPI0022DDDD2B|nr:RNA polymerase sigma-70 factor [Zunongwangia sp. HGR-M22]WBL26706.1 RNA polymerase sigma-70 factor [Zunongwangia sp. HGR-M22]
MKSIQINDFNLLASQVKNGSTLAYKKLFDSLWEPLYRHTQSIVMDEHAAKDILQEIWIDYWNRKTTISPINIRAYLFQAAKYKSLNYLRNTKFNKVHVEALDQFIQEDEFSIDGLEKDKLLGKILEDAINNLPERCKAIFKMSRMEGYTNDEIAQSLNISKRSVENQISIALKKLRVDLKGHELAFVIFSLYLI